VYSCLAWGKRIGAEHYRGAKLYHGRVPAPMPTAHTTQSTMDLLRWLGVRREHSPALRYEVHPVEAALIQEKLHGRPYVVIHPASVMATKRWEPRKFAEVARGIARADSLSW
jgi:ADP-heptose:LPS heptosyltransferase